MAPHSCQQLEGFQNHLPTKLNTHMNCEAHSMQIKKLSPLRRGNSCCFNNQMNIWRWHFLYTFKTASNITYLCNTALSFGNSSAPRSLAFRLSNQNFVRTSNLPHLCSMHHQPHPPWFILILGWIQITEFLNISFFYSLLSLHPSQVHSPQHPVLKHPRSVSFP
jgi:hypothetical protein